MGMLTRESFSWLRHVSPEALRTSHGRYPVSFQAFMRLRLPTRGMGRMWNMRMSTGHRMGGHHQ
jgi:hypothetical protein